MKQILLILIVAILSSLSTVIIYNSFKGSDVKVNEHRLPVKYMDYNEPANIDARIVYSAAPTDFTQAASLTTPAVVHISSKRTRNGAFEEFWGRGPAEASSGSGVIISSDGYIITNNHVIEEGNSFEITLNDRRTFQAELIGKDGSTDLALLKLKSAVNLPVLTFADSDSLGVGEWVLAVGNPFNLNSTVTAGIVSAKARNINILDGDYSIESFIQTDAAVNPGNSGGALVNTRGELVGINTAIITRSGRYEGYSFAVPSNLVQKIILDLRDFGIVQRGFLGVLITDVNPEIAERYKLPNLEGVYISRVNSGSAAADAGLKEGDIITAVNGVKVRTTPELQEQVARYRPGNLIEVDYVRNGKIVKGEVVLKNKSNTTTLINKKEDSLMAEFGFELRDLNSTEKKKLKTGGVMVLSITKGGRIFETNMEPGFIITKVNSKKVDDLTSLMSELQKSNTKILLEGVYEDYPGEYFYEFYR